MITHEIANDNDLDFLPRLAPIGAIARRLGIKTRVAAELPCRTVRIGRQLHVYLDDLKLLFQAQDVPKTGGESAAGGG